MDSLVPEGITGSHVPNCTQQDDIRQIASIPPLKIEFPCAAAQGNGFESLIAFLQALVFTVPIGGYLNDALHMHP
jgi:hypothetical protein